MPLNNRTARVGSKFRLDNEPFNIFTVHTISPPGSTGLSFAHGPIIDAWLKPGGFGVTIDESTENVEWIEEPPGVLVVDKLGHPIALGDSVIVAENTVQDTVGLAVRTVTGIRAHRDLHRTLLDLGTYSNDMTYSKVATEVIWHAPASPTE
jgi:hypothetical protein